MAHYIDTSALVKMVVTKTETPALRSWIAAERPTLISSDLTRTELLRVVRRTLPDRVEQARRVLDSITLMKVSTAIFEAAGLVDPDILRSSDALHLASALELGDDLDAVVSYDDRMIDAARQHGIAVVTPR
ncbi:type II toxin-antitoxin system VapC family toxin [Propionimicrobium sp. PCR01-08-3]|uniref:type II toxin-antitoxin system VapC family toxin n=1 Tax=Propionimicrobium sp. PCR01-08-3 TaxID=3052086 RepID=UPI00255D0B11|nr:type II toxin-antitoxin system VapC family toxin [Propionimicrobium sp. PCR01-08-3]WIY82961.1 type II toxin-antitoxin system VapC family toxin [Propionimicrobium sp. PCR01-08-3]